MSDTSIPERAGSAPVAQAHDAHRPTAQPPLVTIAMPVRNEAEYIKVAIEALLQQDYPLDRIEIIVADGQSNDGTRQILEELSRQHPQVSVIDNPGLIVPTGLNAVIAQSRGEIIVRLDGHAAVAPDFIRQNVALLEEHLDAWVVGGPIVHVGRTVFGQAAAEAMGSPFGSGPATHRFANFEGFAESAAFPAIRNWVFKRIGNFDEQLVRNSDDEFNFRVTQAGGKVYLSPRVKYEYYVRDSLAMLFRQYYQYSFWRIPMVRKHRRPTSMRQMIPPFFFLAMLLLLVVGMWLRQPLLAIMLPLLYCVALMIIAIPVIRLRGLTVACLVPVAMSAMHFSYALGIAHGLWAAVFAPRAWDSSGTMSKLSR